MSVLRAILLAVATSIAAAATAAAAETSRQFDVNASIVKGCSVSAGSGTWGKIDFGTMSGLSSAVVEADLVSNGAGGLRIECTPGTSVTLAADSGQHAIAGQRRLAQTGVGAAVPYVLFANGVATPWTTQQIALSFPAGTTIRSIPIKGRATLPGALHAGRYIDTVRITVAW